MEILICSRLRSLIGDLFCLLILIFKLNAKPLASIVATKSGVPLNPQQPLESMEQTLRWIGMYASETAYAQTSAPCRSTRWWTRLGTPFRTEKLTQPANRSAFSVLRVSCSVQRLRLKLLKHHKTAVQKGKSFGLTTTWSVFSILPKPSFC